MVAWTRLNVTSCVACLFCYHRGVFTGDYELNLFKYNSGCLGFWSVKRVPNFCHCFISLPPPYKVNEVKSTDRQSVDWGRGYWMHWWARQVILPSCWNTLVLLPLLVQEVTICSSHLFYASITVTFCLLDFLWILFDNHQTNCRAHSGGIKHSKDYVDKKNQLDVTFCILYFSSNSCSTCFGQPCDHHQELTTAWCYSLVMVCAVAAGRWSSPVGR